MRVCVHISLVLPTCVCTHEVSEFSHTVRHKTHTHLQLVLYPFISKSSYFHRFYSIQSVRPQNTDARQLLVAAQNIIFPGFPGPELNPIPRSAAMPRGLI